MLPIVAPQNNLYDSPDFCKQNITISSIILGSISNRESAVSDV